MRCLGWWRWEISVFLFLLGWILALMVMVMVLSQCLVVLVLTFIAWPVFMVGGPLSFALSIVVLTVRVAVPVCLLVFGFVVLVYKFAINL